MLLVLLPLFHPLRNLIPLLAQPLLQHNLMGLLLLLAVGLVLDLFLVLLIFHIEHKHPTTPLLLIKDLHLLIMDPAHFKQLPQINRRTEHRHLHPIRLMHINNKLNRLLPRALERERVQEYELPARVL